MDRKEIDVRMGTSGVPVGTLVCEYDGRCEISTFRYAETWLKDVRAFPLSPFMPLLLSSGRRTATCRPSPVRSRMGPQMGPSQRLSAGAFTP